jgi:DNA-binding NarL/FixJ family response regulator
MKVLMASVEGAFCPEIEALLASVEGITLMKKRLGPDAVYLIHELQPDLVLLDLDTVPSNDSAFVARIGELHPDSKLVVLSAKEAAVPVLDALLNGAQGHLVKGASTREEIISALHAVRRGASILSPVLAGVILDEVSLRHQAVAES